MPIEHKQTCHQLPLQKPEMVGLLQWPHDLVVHKYSCILSNSNAPVGQVSPVKLMTIKQNKSRVHRHLSLHTQLQAALQQAALQGKQRK